MRKVIEWITLILLAVLTLFQALLLYLGQFGHDFSEGGLEPTGLRYEWLLLICKLVGLGISRRTGLLMFVAGLVDWVFGIVFLRIHSQHESLSAAVSDSWFTAAYLLPALIYIVVSQRWWVAAARSRDSVARPER